jgi:phosphatidate cytidylyltransferase
VHGQAEQPRLRWGDLPLRVASAAVLAPLALACIWLGGTAFNALVALVAIGLCAEAWTLHRRGHGGRGLLSAAFAYVVIAAASLFWLRGDPLTGRANVVFLMVVVWSADIGAYLTGRLVGGPRLAPRLSPGKTWSGAAGGLLVAVAAGAIMTQILSDAYAPWRATVLAALLAIVAQAGDLLESAVKRRLRIKDTSHLIPGHGGLFDRLDAILAAAPVAALLALALGRGVVLWRW